MTFKYIPGYEELYEISRGGVVSSCSRLVRYSDTHSAFRPGRFLKQSPDKNGYLKVTLYRDGCAKRFMVHRLVGLTFNPPKNLELQINHIDGNKTNNTFRNLEWVTCKVNIHHAHRTGLVNMFGANNKSSKLVDADVVRIRVMIADAVISQKYIAKVFNVSVSCIERISSGATWKHLK